MIKCLANKFLPTQPFKNGLGLTGIRLGALIFGLSGGLVAQLKQDLGQDVSEIKTSRSRFVLVSKTFAGNEIRDDEKD